MLEISLATDGFSATFSTFILCASGNASGNIWSGAITHTIG